MIFTCFIPGEVPTTTHQHQAIRIATNSAGRRYPQIYDTAAIKNERARLFFYLMRERTRRPLLGPVRLYVMYRFKRPKSRKDGEWKDTRPDTDNLIKLLKDCMTEAGCWRDDAQVVWEECCKMYSETKLGIYIYAEELPKQVDDPGHFRPSARPQTEETDETD